MSRQQTAELLRKIAPELEGELYQSWTEVMPRATPQEIDLVVFPLLHIGHIPPLLSNELKHGNYNFIIMESGLTSTDSKTDFLTSRFAHEIRALSPFKRGALADILAPVLSGEAYTEKKSPDFSFKVDLFHSSLVYSRPMIFAEKRSAEANEKLDTLFQRSYWNLRPTALRLFLDGDVESSVHIKCEGDFQFGCYNITREHEIRERLQQLPQDLQRRYTMLWQNDSVVGVFPVGAGHTSLVRDLRNDFNYNPYVKVVEHPASLGRLWMNSYDGQMQQIIRAGLDNNWNWNYTEDLSLALFPEIASDFYKQKGLILHSIFSEILGNYIHQNFRIAPTEQYFLSDVLAKRLTADDILRFSGKGKGLSFDTGVHQVWNLFRSFAKERDIYVPARHDEASRLVQEYKESIS